MMTQTAKKTSNQINSRTNDLEEALEMKAIIVGALRDAPSEDIPKLTDAWAKSRHVLMQMEKQSKRNLASHTDDEIIDYIRSLPERRREAIVTAIQGASLAGRPLF